jgi:DnaJ-class molecular chaperone
MCSQKQTKKDRGQHPCPTCQGRTWINVPLRHGSKFHTRRTCPACHGTGVSTEKLQQAFLNVCELQ